MHSFVSITKRQTLSSVVNGLYKPWRLVNPANSRNKFPLQILITMAGMHDSSDAMDTESAADQLEPGLETRSHPSANPSLWDKVPCRT